MSLFKKELLSLQATIVQSTIVAWLALHLLHRELMSVRQRSSGDSAVREHK